MISLVFLLIPFVFPQDTHESIGTWVVTAYCAGPCCCGKWSDGRTANNHIIQDGEHLIAAPPGIPFGTMLYVPGYGWATVQDRGGSIKGKRLDLLFPTHQEALQWGRREVEVFKQ
jgi:3D (Asp-Asp-Asp) domain-containing protein